MNVWRTTVVMLVAAAAASGLASAQTQPPQKPTATPSAPSAQAAPSSSPQISIEQALYLIRSTLLTLNDANHSGNYTVLRDLSAPGFQIKNSAADLAIIFTDLRKRNFDLYGAALLAPQLTTVPQTDVNKVLRLTGYFPTRPLQIAFDLLFETINGQWRVLGIAVTTPQATVAAAPPQSNQSKKQ